MRTITPADLQKLLATQPDLPLLDVRTPVEFAEVHVPSARNEPLDRLQPKTLLETGGLPTDQPVYLLCRSGARAVKASEKFLQAGFDQTVVVEGGTLAWIEAGLPVTRGTVSSYGIELCPSELLPNAATAPSRPRTRAFMPPAETF